MRFILITLLAALMFGCAPPPLPENEIDPAELNTNVVKLFDQLGNFIEARKEYRDNPSEENYIKMLRMAEEITNRQLR